MQTANQRLKVHPKLRAAFEQHKIVQRKMRKLRTKFKERQKELGVLSKEWNSSRGYKVTSDNFSLFNHGQLYTAIFELAKQKGAEPLRILDEGAGSGKLSQQLENMFRVRGKKVHITAISLHNKSSLLELKKRRIINSLWLKPTETYFPKKPIDVIFSFAGSPNYTLYELRKNSFLKLARCLSKNGFMFVAFGMGLEDAQTSINTTLKGKPFRKSVPSKIYVEGIKKALEKNGFVAEVHAFPFTLSPNFSMLVRRKESALFKQN